MVESHYVLAGTDRNCAGGQFEQHWITCEESSEPGHGYAFITNRDDTALTPPFVDSGRLTGSGCAQSNGDHLYDGRPQRRLLLSVCAHQEYRSLLRVSFKRCALTVSKRLTLTLSRRRRASVRQPSSRISHGVFPGEGDDPRRTARCFVEQAQGRYDF